MLISGVYLATDVYRLILTNFQPNFIFQTVDTSGYSATIPSIWHLLCLCRCWCGCLGRNEVDTIVIYRVDWQQILQLEERQRQGVAEGIEEGKGSQTHVDMNDQFQARPPVL